VNFTISGQGLNEAKGFLDRLDLVGTGIFTKDPGDIRNPVFNFKNMVYKNMKHRCKFVLIDEMPRFRPDGAPLL
jgi:hypothetical protein